MTAEKNIAKGLLIRRALSQSNLAVKSGFYLEAIVLVDSVISECMVRVANYTSEKTFEIKGVNHGCRQYEKHHLELFDKSLIDNTLAWGKKRNSAIHGLTKLHDFNGADWDSRREFARNQAKEGLLIARRWLKESSKHTI